MIKLDIGAGIYPKAGYTSVDNFTAADVKTNMWELPYKSGEVDEIWSSHALEHIEKRKVIPTLKEWRRVLKHNGLLTLEVPDLAWCCKHWLEHQTADWWLDTIFGNQDDPGQFHQTGFTRKILYDYMLEAGFEKDKMTWTDVFNHQQNTIHMEAMK